jgi:tetratricopeptide (TPR) repeat protein
MATSRMPDTVLPYFEKGVQAFTQGSYEYAADLLAYVIKQSPDATEARRYLRLAIQKRHQLAPPSTLTQLGAMLASVPLRAWAGLSAAQGQYRQAAALYEQLLCLQPRSKGLRVALATALTRIGMDDAAVSTYEELLTLHPTNLPALRKLARLSMKRGNDAQARRCFEQLLQLTPNDLEAQQGLRNLDALGTIKRGFST